jgi:hypothetical protein
VTWGNDTQEFERVLPMLKYVETDSPNKVHRPGCIKCRDRAFFISPIGLLCKIHAPLAAAEFGWIPVQVRDSDLIASETWGPGGGS